jgi:hypothetical protein
MVACSSSDQSVDSPDELAVAAEVTKPSPPSQSDTPTTLVDIDFLSDEANTLLSRCASGDASACDASQQNSEISNDGVFSRFHSGCQNGDQDYCLLLDGLVAAEIRMRGLEPEDAPGTGYNGQMITPGGETYVCDDESFEMAFEAGAVFVTDADGNAARLDLLDGQMAETTTFTNGKMTVFRNDDDVRFARGHRVAVDCVKG